MIETDDDGLAADARASGDAFLRFDFIPREQMDLGAELGAEPLRRPRDIAARNAITSSLILSGWQCPMRYTAYSRDRNAYKNIGRYTGGLITYARTLRIVETLENAGLIQHQKTRPTPLPLYRSTMRATERTLSLSPLISLRDLVHSQHELLRLKDEAKHLIGFRETAGTRTWRQDIAEHNQGLRSNTVTLVSDEWTHDTFGYLRSGDQTLNSARIQYMRIFNRSWQMGGRWYGPWWQQLPSHDRARLEINGLATVELDYDFFHPQCSRPLSVAILAARIPI